MIQLISKYYKVFVHVISWLAAFSIQVSLFSLHYGTQIAFQRGILILLIYLFLFYINWFYLIPHFYSRRKFFVYTIWILSLLLVMTILRTKIDVYYNIFLGSLKYPMVRNLIIRRFFISLFVCSFIWIVSSLLRIANLYTYESNQKRTLLQQNTEAEIKLLKSQLNPHFLFNALNNIYALVLTNSENAANSLMSLSQLLRYIIYDASVEKVSLEKEITYLKYYIELESLRLVNKNNLEVSIEEINSTLQIMPLVFIPFVENSFKHSNINQNGFIKVRLKLERKTLIFSCENSYSKNVTQVKDKIGGIGLQNSLKRLELFYPGKHILQVSDNSNIYSIFLTLNL